MNIDRDHFKTFAAGLIMGLLVAGGICAWMKYKPSLPSVIAQPSKELANAKTDTLKCVPLIVYRDSSKKALGLPAAVVKDPSKKVVGSTQVKASEYPHTVSALANIESGQVSMYVRQDRLPWLGTARKGTLGLHYGIQEDGEATTRLGASYSLLQVKKLNLGLTGDISTSGRAFVGIGGEIRF